MSPHERDSIQARGRELRRRAGAAFVEGFFRTASSLGRLHPLARPERHGVEVIHDVVYREVSGRTLALDVYRPRDVSSSRPAPVILYVHGGGFRILSKETHWVMGLSFARQGYVVFNIDYRMAPDRYPAALEDSCAALAWVADHAREYGGDPERLALAGESAGANLVTALAVVNSYPRPEPWARALWERDRGIALRAVVPACGVLQVSDPERFSRRKPGFSPFLQDRLSEVSSAYLAGARAHEEGGLELADPLLLLEKGEPPARPLPAFFVPVGTADPLLDDSRRLRSALGRLGAECEVRYYEGEPHAFHALVWREPARRCWNETFAFLQRHLG